MTEKCIIRILHYNEYVGKNQGSEEPPKVVTFEKHFACWWSMTNLVRFCKNLDIK